MSNQLPEWNKDQLLHTNLGCLITTETDKLLFSESDITFYSSYHGTSHCGTHWSINLILIDSLGDKQLVWVIHS